MSSTNRGAQRAALDNYPTPGWVTRAILPYLDLSGRILEPACGGGAIVREIIDYGICRSRIEGVEIAGVPGMPSPCGIFLACADFMEWHGEPDGSYDLIITNPPYGPALEFVQRAMELRAPGGVVAMLLRLNFAGSQKRAAWLRENPPDVYVLPKRPSFTGTGTDSCEYAWFVWPDVKREAGSFRVLEVAP